MKTKEIKDIIEREMNIWQQAYPKQKKLLEKFANKIKFELEIKNESSK